MAEIIRPNGSRETVTPASKKKGFEYEFLKTTVGGYIEVVSLSEHTIMVINEEGKLLGLPINKAATEIFRENTQSSDYICGAVLICGSKEVK